MSKVYENTGGRLCIYSDNSKYRLIADRRAMTSNVGGRVRYCGSAWYIKTWENTPFGYREMRFQGVKYVVNKREEIIDMLSRSVQFKIAYQELTTK